MTERVMLGLGDFRFEVATAAYQKLSLSQSWRWEVQARIMRDPALQFLGRDVSAIDLDGVIYPGFKGGLGQCDAMRKLADSGKPQQLVDGLGRVWGAWVITEISDTRTIFAGDGQPRKIEFSLKLKAYGEDEGGNGILPTASQKSSSQQTRATGTADKLSALTSTVEALPRLNPSMTPQTLASIRGIMGDTSAILASEGGGFSSELEETLATLPQGGLGSLAQTLRDLLALTGEMTGLRIPALTSPAALYRDLRGLDGRLQLADCRTDYATRDLREIGQSCEALARITDRSDADDRRAAARAANLAITRAESFGEVCAQAQRCTSMILERWHG